MKARSLFQTISALALFAGGTTASLRAEPKIYFSAVAETLTPDAANFAPSPEHPVSCVAVPAGYIEAGDPVGGEIPPEPRFVAQAFAEAMKARGFQPASAANPPAVLAVYHWGVIRPDSFQIRPLNALTANERARLNLVAPRAMAKRLESDVVAESNFRTARLGLRWPFRNVWERDTLILAGESHYFVVVSAFDYAALKEHQRKLVWQVKLTTKDTGYSATEAIAGMLRNGNAYFGRNEAERVDDAKPMYPQGRVQVGPMTTVDVESPPPAGVDPAVLREAVETDRTFFSGRPNP